MSDITEGGNSPCSTTSWPPSIRGDEAAVKRELQLSHTFAWAQRAKVTVWQAPGDYKLKDFLARAGDGWAKSQWEGRNAHPCRVRTRCIFAVEFQPLAQGTGPNSAVIKSIYVVDPAGRSFGACRPRIEFRRLNASAPSQALVRM